MSRESFVFLIGFIVFFIPFLGIPREWKEWTLITLGVLLMFVGYKLRRAAFLRSIMHASGEHRSEAFVEHVHLEKEVSSPDTMLEHPESTHHTYTSVSPSAHHTVRKI